MARVPRSPKTPTRYPFFRYKSYPTLPCDHYDGPNGPLVQDALSGNWFPQAFQIDGPYGPTDSRNGATNDIDIPEHEMAVTMEGPIPQAITPNMR